MNIIGQRIVDALREYGPTTLGVLDLMFYNKNPNVILQHIEHLIHEGIVLACDGRKVGAKRPMPALALKGQIQ